MKKPYKCSICSRKFLTEESVLQHGSDAHPGKSIYAEKVEIKIDPDEMSEWEHIGIKEGWL